MAASTLSRVSGRTFGCSFSTRETVWCDTPASRATSAITGGRDRLPAVAGALTRLLAFSPGDDVTPCLPLPPRRGALRSAGADVSVNICAGRVAVLASRRPRQRHAPVPAPPGFPVPQSSRRAARAVARGTAGARRPGRSGRRQSRQAAQSRHAAGAGPTGQHRAGGRVRSGLAAARRAVPQVTQGFPGLAAGLALAQVLEGVLGGVTGLADRLAVAQVLQRFPRLAGRVTALGATQPGEQSGPPVSGLSFDLAHRGFSFTHA